MNYFVIVNRQSKLPEQYPDTSGLTTPAQIEQWIEDKINSGGMNADQELVASYEPTIRPQADERLFDIVETKQYNSNPHPIYSNIKQWLITYSQPIIKTIEMQKEVVDNKENEASETTIPYHKRLKVTMLATRSLMKYLSLSTNTQINAVSSDLLSDKDKKRLRLFRAIANKIHNNDIERDNKHAQIDSSQTPDLEANWDLNNYTESI